MPAFAGILAAPVALQLVDRRCLRSPHDVKRDGLVPVAAKATDFTVAVSRNERITQRRRWLRRTLKAQHALIRRLDGELVSFPARLRGPLCRRPNRSAVMVSRDLVPIATGCMAARRTGKPLRQPPDFILPLPPHFVQRGG
jgi:hypothetical protein